MNTGRVAVLQFTYPAVALVIDWVFFEQRLGGVQLFGIALMSMAIWFAEHRTRLYSGAPLSAPVADHVKPQSTTEASLNS